MKAWIQGIALIVLAVGGGLAFLGVHLSSAVADWNAVISHLDEHYPDLERLGPPALAELMDSDITLLLLDARAEDEFAVSQLADARWIGYDEEALNRAGTPPDRVDRVLVYSAVGLRSAPVAKRLQDAGWPNVAVLDGGIFTWANTAMPVVDDQGRAVQRVHRWNGTWKELLRPELRVR
jgi:rhodanese-related sulfurtransferase